MCPDFVRWTEERLLGPRSRARRAIAGISMGGYGAVKIALAHPGEFVAAASLSGSFTLPGAFFDDGGRREELLRSIFGPPGDERMRDEADVHRLASCLDPDAAPELYLACGTADRYGFHDGALALHRTLASRGIGSCLVLDEGGHDVRYWRRALPPMLRFVGACFGWRAPAGAPDAKR